MGNPRARALRSTNCTYRLTIMDLALELLCHVFSFLPKPEGLRLVRSVSRGFRAAANRCVSQVRISGSIMVPGAGISKIVCRVSAELLCQLHKSLQDQENSTKQIPAELPWVVFSVKGIFHGPKFLAHVTKVRINNMEDGHSQDRCRSCCLPHPASLEDTLANMPLLEKVVFGSDYSIPSRLDRMLKNVTHIDVEEYNGRKKWLPLTRISSLKSLCVKFAYMGISSDSSGSPFCTTAFSQLSALHMPVVMSEFFQLSGLTSLTRLAVDYNSPGPPGFTASALGGLTGLSHLKIDASVFSTWEDNATRVTTTGWSCLGALTGLTCFSLTGAPMLMSNLSELGALTALTRLQRLEIREIPGPPTLGARCPLPLELAVLGTATALEHLELEPSSAYIAGLNPPAQAALQDALSRLPALTHVELKVAAKGDVWGLEGPIQEEEHLADPFLPLQLLSSASRLLSLQYTFPGRGDTLPEDAAAQRGLLSGCHRLRSLVLKRASSSQAATLLDGLTAPHLTKLSLDVDLFTLPVMQAVLRFTTLTDLSLYASYESRVAVLQLPALSQLLELKLGVYPKQGRDNETDLVWQEWWSEFVKGLLDQLNCRRLAACLPPLSNL
eukprot:jgi/Botrbrau1/7582/Bobra.0159s0031.1